MKLASFLLSFLERIAVRFEEYYMLLSHESIYRPEIENHPARTRWHNIRRKTLNGSFFILARVPSLFSTEDFVAGSQARSTPHVDFAQIFASAPIGILLVLPKTRKLRVHSKPSSSAPR
jgi:hypothetical protein